MSSPAPPPRPSWADAGSGSSGPRAGLPPNARPRARARSADPDRRVRPFRSLAAGALQRVRLRLRQQRAVELVEVDLGSEPDALLGREHAQRRQRRALPGQQVVRLALDGADELLELLGVAHGLVQAAALAARLARPVLGELPEVVQDRHLA